MRIDYRRRGFAVPPFPFKFDDPSLLHWHKTQASQARRVKALSKIVSNHEVTDTGKRYRRDKRRRSLQLEKSFRSSGEMTRHAVHEYFSVISPRRIFGAENFERSSQKSKKSQIW